MDLRHKPRQLVVDGTYFAFATPIRAQQFDEVDDLNQAITSLVTAWKRGDPGRKYSNQGGWHSPNDLLQRLGPPHAPRLCTMFVQCVKAVLSQLVEQAEFPRGGGFEAWAIVNQAGHWNAPHIHPACPWSGVYYAATEPNAGGRIGFTDPRTQALMLNHPLAPWHALNNLRIEPKPGLMVIFPSFLYHYVEPYTGKSPRISVAMNLLQ